ncbi:flagellar export chaperone FliS [Alkaliphilus serpentinus]|uniref:Flagellar export chaperone FliS n=1 Tax=Alkaliphilus serpentinus TaxID=1482731 RepID=A0A833HQI8_9FIRM|nr:flagellar export chaperone FliS [Alkaliphilus serpentinus]KAB3532060.1 flagellar export chaperone FliS [Alkaliphilus serpentinus]
MLNKDYVVNRVATANGIQLVTLMYEGMAEHLQDARVAIVNQEENNLRFHIQKVRDILTELLATLEGTSDIASSLRTIYIYLNKLVTDALNKKDPSKIEDALKVIKPIEDAWQQLAETQSEDNHKPAVVAGLTYGKGQLRDYVVEETQWKKG